jgi:hypothetical protein
LFLQLCGWHNGTRLCVGSPTLTLVHYRVVVIRFDQSKCDLRSRLRKVNHFPWIQPALAPWHTVANLDEPVAFRLDHPPVGNLSDLGMAKTKFLFLGQRNVAGRVAADCHYIRFKDERVS